MTIFCRYHSVHRLIQHGRYSLSSGSAVCADLPGTVLDYWGGEEAAAGTRSSPGTAAGRRGHRRWEALVCRWDTGAIMPN